LEKFIYISCSQLLISVGFMISNFENSAIIYKNTSEDYYSMIRIFQLYCEKILTFVPRVNSLQDYPSHGIDHSLRIIAYINSFIESFNIEITDEEVYLLYLAAWVHDIGCICGREDHNEDSVKILSGDCDFYNLLEDKHKTCLNFIILSHRKKYDINTVPETIDIIRLKYLCAIFRLMDACDIARDRCPPIVYKYIKESLPADSQKYWESHLNIISVTFHGKDIVIDASDPDKVEDYIEKEFKEEINTVSEILSKQGLQLNVKLISAGYL